MKNLFFLALSTLVIGSTVHAKNVVHEGASATQVVRIQPGTDFLVIQVRESICASAVEDIKMDYASEGNNLTGLVFSRTRVPDLKDLFLEDRAYGLSDQCKNQVKALPGQLLPMSCYYPLRTFTLSLKDSLTPENKRTFVPKNGELVLTMDSRLKAAVTQLKVQ